jgi:hypothetical protein
MPALGAFTGIFRNLFWLLIFIAGGVFIYSLITGALTAVFYFILGGAAMSLILWWIGKASIS